MYLAKITKERIKSLCKSKAVSMEDMLIGCSLGVNAIRQINDTKGMASFSLAKIADYLDTSVDYLLGRTDDPTFVPKVASNIRTLPKPGGTVAAMDGIYVPPRDALSPEARDVLDKAARLEREKQNEIE